MRSALALLPVVAIAACRPAAPPERTGPPDFGAAMVLGGQTLPFSDAVRVGDLLFLSGQIGNVPGKMELVPGGIGPEAKQVMENIQAILARHGSSMDDVVKCTAFLADMREWPAFNEVYRTYFAAHFPARAAFGATGLAAGARVEVDCIAYVPPPPAM